MLNFLAIFLQSEPLGTEPSYPDSVTVWHHMSYALDQSLDRVLSLLIAILPGILAFFVAFVVFTLIGIAISAGTRRFLLLIKFDDRIARRQGSGGWSPMTAPTDLVARVAFWGFLLLGLMIGVSAFDTSYASAAALPISLLPYLTHLVGAVLLLLAGVIIARFLARSVLIGAVNAQLQYARFLALGVKWLVLVLAAAMALEHLEIGGVVVDLAFGILFGGIVLTLALAVGLGSRELVSRSLESHVERTSERAVEPVSSQDDGTSETIRHF